MTEDQLQALEDTLEAEVGVLEEGGQNCGARINEFQAATGNGPGDSYCQSFIVWGLKKTLGHSPILASGRCQSVREWADGKGWTTSDPAIHSEGWAVNGENHAHHTFLVTSDPDESGYFTTVEGNTNDRGDSNGDGVYDRTRGGPDDHNRYVFLPLSKV